MPFIRGSEGAFPSLLRRYVPMVGWLPRYRREWLRFDLIAGFTVWGTTVPTAMGYAQLAGLPVQAGLYAAMVALLAYAVFGTSSLLKVETSPSMAVMSAAVVAPMAMGNTAYYITLSAALGLVVGLVLIAAGLARMGFLADLLAKPVVIGFLFALAIGILISQLPTLLGIPAGSGSLLSQLWQLITSLGETNPWTLAISVVSFSGIWLFKRFLPRFPGTLVVIALSIVAVAVLNLEEHGVAVVGAIPDGLPAPQIPWVQPSDLLVLFLGATAMVFVALGESVGTARTFAAEHHSRVDADQELLALGVANLGAGLMQGFSVGANPATTSSTSAARTKTQVASIVTALLLMLTVATRVDILSNLPQAVVAVAVSVSVSHLLNRHELGRLYRARRIDFLLAMVALVGVIIAGILVGLLIAVFLSLILVLYRFSQPHIAVLGRIRDQRVYGELKEHQDAEQIPGLLIVRPNVPLFFTNASTAHSRIRSLVSQADTRLVAVIVDLRASADLDVATTDMLRHLSIELSAADISFLLADAQSTTRDRLRHTGLLDLIGEENLYLSISTAVQDVEQRLSPGAPGGESP